MAKKKPIITPDTIQKELMRAYFSNLARISHKKNPRTRVFYQEMAKKRQYKKKMP